MIDLIINSLFNLKGTNINMINSNESENAANVIAQ
jgi:hypothetical protein